MVFRRLNVTVNAANKLKNLRLGGILGTMDVYVVVSLYGDGLYIANQSTSIHQDSGTSPQWGQTFSFFVHEEAAHAGRLVLRFEIKDHNKALGQKDVGWVNVQIKKLLEQGNGAGDGTPMMMNPSVTLPEGKTKGFLSFSYEFGERFTEAPPPSFSSSVAGHPPNASPTYLQQGNQTQLLGGLLTVSAAIANIGATIAGAL